MGQVKEWSRMDKLEIYREGIIWSRYLISFMNRQRLGTSVP